VRKLIIEVLFIWFATENFYTRWHFTIFDGNTVIIINSNIYHYNKDPKTKKQNKNHFPVMCYLMSVLRMIAFWPIYSVK